MAYYEFLCKDPDKKIMFDPITRRYFLASQAQLATASLLLTTNKMSLQRQAVAYASCTELLHAMIRYRKKIEEEQRHERKRIKNRKKWDRMKRLRVKKVKK